MAQQQQQQQFDFDKLFVNEEEDSELMKKWKRGEGFEVIGNGTVVPTGHPGPVLTYNPDFKANLTCNCEYCERGEEAPEMIPRDIEEEAAMAIARGMNAPQTDQEHRKLVTALLEAVKKNEIDTVKETMETNDIEYTCKKRAAEWLLVTACQSKSFDVVKYWLEQFRKKGPDDKWLHELDPIQFNIEHPDPWMRGTPLTHAANVGHKELCQLLLDYGAAVDAVDKIGQTPLVMATMNNEHEVMRLLLKEGADPNTKYGEKQQSNLGIACKHGNKEAIDVLVEAGADLAYIDKDKLSPLNHAEDSAPMDIVFHVHSLMLARGMKVPDYYKDADVPETPEAGDVSKATFSDDDENHSGGMSQKAAEEVERTASDIEREQEKLRKKREKRKAKKEREKVKKAEEKTEDAADNKGAAAHGKEAAAEAAEGDAINQPDKAVSETDSKTDGQTERAANGEQAGEEQQPQDDSSDRSGDDGQRPGTPKGREGTSQARANGTAQDEQQLEASLARLTMEEQGGAQQMEFRLARLTVEDQGDQVTGSNGTAPAATADAVASGSGTTAPPAGADKKAKPKKKISAAEARMQEAKTNFAVLLDEARAAQGLEAQLQYTERIQEMIPELQALDIGVKTGKEVIKKLEKRIALQRRIQELLAVAEAGNGTLPLEMLSDVATTVEDARRARLHIAPSLLEQAEELLAVMEVQENEALEQQRQAAELERQAREAAERRAIEARAALASASPANGPVAPAHPVVAPARPPVVVPAGPPMVPPAARPTVPAVAPRPIVTAPMGPPRPPTVAPTRPPPVGPPRPPSAAFLMPPRPAYPAAPTVWPPGPIGPPVVNGGRLNGQPGAPAAPGPSMIPLGMPQAAAMLRGQKAPLPHYGTSVSHASVAPSMYSVSSQHACSICTEHLPDTLLVGPGGTCGHQCCHLCWDKLVASVGGQLPPCWICKVVPIKVKRIEG